MNYKQFQFTRPPALRWIYILLLIILIGNLAGLWGVGVHTDEAYYWAWSQRLDWGYYDHPPLVAWMVRLFSEIFGNGELALRLPAVLAWLASLFVVFRLSAELFRNPAAGWTSMLVVASLPIFQIGFHIVGPDSPLMLFSALTYYFVHRAIVEKNSNFWLVGGCALGMALLGKYTAVLLPGVVFFGLLLHRETRPELTRLHPWIAIVIAVVIFMPMVIWNYQNDWISFSYQWGHGTATNQGFSFYKILDYVVQQMSSVMPWVFVLMMIAAFQAKKYIHGSLQKILPLFLVGFWLPLLFFGITGSISKSMHNWPVIAYIPGSILLGGVVANWIYPIWKPGETAVNPRKRVKSLVVASVMLAVLIVNLARFPQWANLLDKPEKLAGSSMVAVWGWQQLADSIRRVETAEKLAGDCKFLFVSDFNNSGLGYYHAAGEMAYQFEDLDRIVLEKVPHFKQYNLWMKQSAAEMTTVCLVIAGPSNKENFPVTLNKNTIGNLVLRKKIAIQAPDTTNLYYAIYVKEKIK